MRESVTAAVSDSTGSFVAPNLTAEEVYILRFAVSESSSVTAYCCCSSSCLAAAALL